MISEMGRHITEHGDGVKDIAFEVEDCAKLFKVLLYYLFLLPNELFWGFVAWLKFLYGQGVRFPASSPCLSFPALLLYIACTKAVLTGLKAY